MVKVGRKNYIKINQVFHLYEFLINRKNVSWSGTYLNVRTWGKARLLMFLTGKDMVLECVLKEET
jgi:hypothetical protein